MNSFKTIDGGGANVLAGNGGACLTLQFASNIIIHGIHIHDCRPTGNAMVRSSPTHYGWRTMADGIWVDHNSLSNCADGLVDAIMSFEANARLIQRMPRHGYFHVINNDYTHWEMYAIGGSASPSINSQGNRYLAPKDPFAEEVTERVDTAENEWKSWNWRSEGDMLLNGAYFTASGAGASASYARASSLGAKSSSMVGSINDC
ncbi:putative pectate lyase 15 [Drosera capensis]